MVVTQLFCVFFFYFEIHYTLLMCLYIYRSSRADVFTRSVFRTYSNIYNRAFLQKYFDILKSFSKCAGKYLQWNRILVNLRAWVLEDFSRQNGDTFSAGHLQKTSSGRNSGRYSWLSYGLFFYNKTLLMGSNQWKKQRCHVSTLGHLENWAKRTFSLKPVREYSFENLEPLTGSGRNMTRDIKWHETWHKIQRIHTSPTRRTLNWAGLVGPSESLVLRSLERIVLSMSGLEFSDNFLAKTRGSRSKQEPKILFFLFFYPLVPHLILITAKTSRDSKHYHICINPLEKFCHNIYQSFQGARSFENWSFTPSFKGSWFGHLPNSDYFDKSNSSLKNKGKTNLIRKTPFSIHSRG